MSTETIKNAVEKVSTSDLSAKFVQRFFNEDFLLDLVGKAISLSIRVILAFIIYHVGKKVLDRFITSYEKTNYYKNMDKSFKTFLNSFMNLGAKVLLIIISLMFLGMKGSSLVAFLGTMGLGIGLALKDSLSNLAGGLIILTFNQYSVEDHIDINNLSGIVKSINVFSTTIVTFDNKVITIPNGIMVSNAITNFSEKPVRRVDLVASISYDDDIELAKRVLREMAEENESVLKTPEVQVLVGEYADSSINIFVRCWCRTDDYWSIYYDLIDRLKPTFDKHNLSIPYPQMDIHKKESK